jgi:hypothetical protein
MKNILKLSIVFIFGLVMNSCYYDDVPPSANEEPIPPGTVITYKADIAPMLSGCTGCHAGTQAPDLRNTLQAYNGLFPNYVVKGNPTASKLYYAAPGNLTSGHMSVGVNLSATQLTTMKFWIENQAIYE